MSFAFTLLVLRTKMLFSPDEFPSLSVKQNAVEIGFFLTLFWCSLALCSLIISKLSHLMGKPTICIGENKGADQLRSNCEADQRLCFRYSDSTVPLLLKSEISSF